MKLKINLLIILAGLCLTMNLFSQSDNPDPKKDYSNYPYWIVMMQDHSVNFYEVQKAFNEYWEGREITKGSGWKPFKRWEWWQERHIYSDGTRHESDKVFKEYMKYLETHPDAKSSEADWTNLGPFAIPSKGYEGLGRINAIAFHPTDPDILFIGAPAGGCWKYDASKGEWSSTTDDLPTLGVSAIVVDWNNPDNIYNGTGDRDAGDATGLGVFRSQDGGQTWELWNNGMGNKTVGRMIQHPTNPDVMYAATIGGIYKTTDAGTNWIMKAAGGFKDIVFKPGNPSIMYSGGDGRFYKSSDNGENWVQISNGIEAGSRSVIAVTPADPNYVYCLLSNGDSYKGLWRSTDSGESFTMMSNSPNIMSWGCDGGDGGQAWYDLDIAADPNNKNMIFAGGVNCFRSTNGGTSWQISSHWWGDCGVPAVHADLHVLEYNPLNDRLYAGNDGGIYYTGNQGNSWPEITSGLPISQVYRIGQCKIDKNKVINGYQDNGTSTYYGDVNGWQTTNGGDGMECAFDHTQSSYSYSTIYYGDIYRHINNNGSYQVAGNGSHGMNESGGWITPFCLHEGNSNIMFGGYQNMWRAEGIKTNNFEWEKITEAGGGEIDVVEHSPADYDLLYYARNSSIYRSDNVNDDTPEWFNLNNNLPGSGNVFDIEAHPFEDNVVFITKGSKVYRSDDRGMNWTDISGTLPNINMNSISFYENSIEGIYVASDAGVYYRDASMDDWTIYSNGLPVDASINEIEIYHNPDNPYEDAIRAGTYGRGMWSSPVWCGELTADFEAESTTTSAGCGINFFDRSSGVPMEWEWSFEGGTPSTSNLKNPENIVYYTEGNYCVTLTVTNTESTDNKTITGYIVVTEASAPEVYFVASDSITCPGTVIHFTDMSGNCPTGWEWEISPSSYGYVNGTSYHDANPDIVFNDYTSYTVTLHVTNNSGTASFAKENYIQTNGLSIPFSDDFESGSFTEKSWIIENPDIDKTWNIAQVAGSGSGDYAAYMNFFNYIVPPGQRDRLISPVLNFEGYNQVFLTFRHAYAKRFIQATDSLIVYISNDCGESWTRIFEGGDDNNGSFATHELTIESFVPQTPEDWCGTGWGAACNVLDLSPWAGQGSIRVMFESYNYYGNNLYIDDVMIGSMTDISMMEMDNEIHIFPNPTTGMVNIVIPENTKSFTVKVYNMQGAEIPNTDFQGAKSNFSADLSNYGEGLYFIQVKTDRKNFMGKVLLRK
ncbi:MAG: T9SS type A sorting domain-containing protein [Bacteroidales bacterium]|nr:T9SS type A sorting domain-containing protein [Bacteroidales bacterium]